MWTIGDSSGGQLGMCVCLSVFVSVFEARRAAGGT